MSLEQRVETADVVYFRPDQIEDTTHEANRLAEMLNAPPHIANQVSNRQELARSLSNLRKSLTRHSPAPYRGTEMDTAKARAAKLEAEMKAGMPTHEEMRVGGVGMADKLLKWEKKNKKNAIEWKNLQTRMHVTECEGGRIDRVKDLGNVDRFRPWGKADATDAQIKTTEYHFNPGPITPSVIFNDAEIATVAELQPDLAKMLGQMTNEQRSLLKSLLDGGQIAKPAKPVKAAKPAKAKRVWTEEQKQTLRDNLARGKAEKLARSVGNGISVSESS